MPNSHMFPGLLQPSVPGRLPEAASGCFLDAQRVRAGPGCRAALENSERRLRVATVRRQWEQSLAEHRRRLADPPMRPAASERQVRRYSGQPPDELANVRYRRPPTFARQIRTTAASLERVLAQRQPRSADGRQRQFADLADS